MSKKNRFSTEFAKLNANATRSIGKSMGNIQNSERRINRAAMEADMAGALLMGKTSGSQNNANMLLKQLRNENRLEQMRKNANQKEINRIKNELTRVRGYGPQSIENLERRLAELKEGLPELLLPNVPKHKVHVYEKKNNKTRHNKTESRHHTASQKKGNNLNLNSLFNNESSQEEFFKLYDQQEGQKLLNKQQEGQELLNALAAEANTNNNLARKFSKLNIGPNHSVKRSGTKHTVKISTVTNVKQKLDSYTKSASLQLQEVSKKLPLCDKNEEIFKETLKLLENAKIRLDFIKTNYISINPNNKRYIDKLLSEYNKYVDTLNKQYAKLRSMRAK